MSSIIEGYNYDIFISYRQKDNKGDRWVSEFVAALKDELDATFKETISIYFDENPHDGLLETHDVDASLKEKLKCLIFIPIISRTYCDPKAFAWEHEFMAFVGQASDDLFGLKVTLPNSNVATRVLPIRIHDLSVEDTRLCESVLGGVMRGVDFIYKSPGVNRPLRSNEDHPQDNQNKTYYRDQINKVANAISDIMSSLKFGKAAISEKTDKKPKEIRINKDYFSEPFKGRKLKKGLIILSGMLILSVAGYFTLKYVNLNNTENTFAFVWLQNNSNDSSLVKPAEEFIAAVYEKLTRVNGISIKAPFLTDLYDPTGKSLTTIRKDLGANYVLFCRIKREGKSIKIAIDLSNTRESELLLNKQYTWSNDLLSKNTQEIARMIAGNMGLKLSPEEERQLERELSDNPDVNMELIKANQRYKDAWVYYNYGPRLLDSVSFLSAVEDYNKVLKKDSSVAEAYAKRAIARAWGIYLNQVDSSNIEKCLEDIKKARSLDKELPDIDIAQGFYYYYCTGEYDNALESFKMAALKDPGNYQPLFYMSLVLRRKGEWAECQKLINRVVLYNPNEALFLTNIGMTFTLLHKYDSALIYHNKAVENNPRWKDSYKNKFVTLILKSGITSEARKLIDNARTNTGDNMIEYRILISMYDRKYEEAIYLAENADPDDFHITGEKHLYLAKLNSAVNNQQKALQYYSDALAIISEALRKNPNECELHGELGLAYAGLGYKTKAIEEVNNAIKIASKKNKMDETDMKLFLAQVYTMLGDYDNALTQVLFLLGSPSFLSEKLLMFDPVWKPLLDKPEYRKKIKQLKEK